jgi:hypothetical protein
MGMCIVAFTATHEASMRKASADNTQTIISHVDWKAEK